MTVQALARQGWIEGAGRVLRRIAEENPGLEVAACGLAELEAREGRFDEALARLERLLDRNPASDVGLSTLAWLEA